jgi:hypothetical protein
MLKFNPDGFMISNGPGDPGAMPYAIETVKKIVEAGVPLFGICLGHQILSESQGLKTYKMHNGHRGLNHPVKNIITGHCEITSQNHGFAVSMDEIKNNSLQLKYLNSCIWSKQEFKYGYFECRCKAPSGKGLWPAFWLYGQNQKDEIDFMEMKGEKEFETHVDVHVPNTTDKVPGFLGFKQDWGGWIKTEQKLTDEWVIFSGIWKPGSLIYYVNGVPVSHFKGDFETSMNLIANLANAVDNGPFKPGPDEKTVFPNEFLVDYIRVWKSNENPSNVNIKKVNVRDENKVMSSADIPSIKFKKKVGLIYDTKLFKKEIGFVALVPVGDRSYQIQANGEKLKNAKIKIIDTSGTVLNETFVKTQFTNLNLSNLKKGDYTLQLQHNKIKQSIQLKL